MMIADIIYIMAGGLFFGICLLFAGVFDTYFHSNKRGSETQNGGDEDYLKKKIVGGFPK